jgi:signal transduction histidine kinase
MFKSILNWGVTPELELEQRQVVRLTNVIGLLPLIAYIYYVGYGIAYEKMFSVVLAGSMIVLTLVAFWLNGRGHYGLAKTFLFSLTGFAIWITYQVFTVDYMVLTSFFPVLFCFGFFLDPKKERPYFIISLAITAGFLISAVLLDRFIFYKIELDPVLQVKSNYAHLFFSFILTAFIVIVMLTSQQYTKRQLIESKEQIVKAIYDIKQTQDHLVQSKKMASLGILVAGVSHEINNPLNYLKGGVFGLKKLLDNEQIEHAQEVRRLLGEMSENIDQTAGIVKSLNHFSHHKGSIDGNCDIREVVHHILDILHSYIEDKKISVKCEIPIESLVKGHSGKLHQIFLNIISYATGVIPDNGGALNITSKTDAGMFACFIGGSLHRVSKELLASISSPHFVNFKGVQDEGLSLFIAYQLIKEHNGDMQFLPTKSEGYEIVVRLPIYDIDQPS